MTVRSVGFRTIGVAAIAATLALAARVESGTVLELRLRQEINSNSTVQGSRFEAVVVSPVLNGEREAIPAGTIARGIVDHVAKVGVGLIHERASIGLHINELELPDGRRFVISSQVVQLENAREAVDRRGRILGIRSTNTPGYRATGLLVSLASVEPIALLFSSTAFATILRFSEPEIRLTTGAEFRIKLNQPLETGDDGFPISRSPITHSLAEKRRLAAVLQRMPVRTSTPTGVESDLTNILFIGDSEALSRAFAAAGWSVPENVNAASRYRTLRAVAEVQAYHEAPMSELLWNGSRPILNRAKSLNSFSRRHHIRVFHTPELWDGRPVMIGAATQDSGIGFSMREKGFVHLIDSWIDKERTKVLDDLAFTGCIDGTELVPRFALPRNARNATGDRIVTDGAVVAIRINDCLAPRRADEEVAPPPGPYRGNALLRASRRFFLTARNDLIRGNIAYQGVSLSVAGTRMLMRRPGRDPGEAPASITMSNREIALVADEAFPPPPELPTMSFISPVTRPAGPAMNGAASRKKKEDERWSTPPHMELAIHFGSLRYGSQTAGAEGLIISKKYPNGTRGEATVLAGNTIHPGWQLGGSLTVNSSRWFSHEIGFAYQRGSFELDLSSTNPNTTASLQTNNVDQRAGLLTRQFSYGAMLQLRPRESRWSPYLVAGPALQLIHLTDAPFQKAKGVFRLGLSNIGMIQSAYNFGSAPPLEGGGIFQPALQAGGGIKLRVHPRWTLRLDYRSTISAQPDFLTKSLVTTQEQPLEPGGPPRVDPVQGLKRGLLIQRRFTTGFAFTF